MKISKILNYQTNYKFLPLQNAKNTTTSCFQQTDIENSNLPVYSYKANLQPSFGKTVRNKTLRILDKSTEKIINASLIKNVKDDLVSFDMYVKNVGIASIDIKFNYNLPKTDDSEQQEQDNAFPCVTNLKIIQEDKYQGIGSALLNLAVEESMKKGKNGALFLSYENSFPFCFDGSLLVDSENSLPFLFKLGFEAVDKELDKNIRKGLRTSNHTGFPEKTMLFLPANRQGYLRRFHSEKYGLMRNRNSI